MVYDAVTVTPLEQNKALSLVCIVHVLSQMGFYMFELLSSHGDLIISLWILDLNVFKHLMSQ